MLLGSYQFTERNLRQKSSHHVEHIHPPLLLASDGLAADTYSSMVVNKDNGGSSSVVPSLESTIPVHRITGIPPRHTVPLHQWIQKSRTSRLRSYQ